MSPVESHPAVMFIGDADHVEFQPALTWLAQETRLTRAKDVAMAITDCAMAERASDDGVGTSTEPDLIIFAQPRPGWFSDKDVEKVHRVFPLSRLVMLLGTCCEGEMRTGKPCAGVLRVYWYQFMLQIPHRLRAQRSGHLCDWDLGRISADADRTLIASRDWINDPALKDIVVVHACHRIIFDSYAEPLAACGYRVVPHADNASWESRSLAVGIWDDDPRSWDVMDALQEFVGEIAPAPVFAVIGFPRWHERQACLQAGARECFAKPLAMGDIVQAVRFVSEMAQAAPAHGLP